MSISESKIEIVSADKIIPLRHVVLRPKRPVETAHFDGDHDPETMHLAAILENRVVGCLSLMKQQYKDLKEEAFQLRGMATHPDVRGKGVGAKLLSYTDEILSKMGVSVVWCNARVEAISFYEKSGWVTDSDLFMVEHVGLHRKMKKPIL